ncbi:MAG: GyrI-like domain-containing protein [Methanobrevibacter sp.]
MVEEKTIKEENIAVISNKGSLETAKLLFARLSGWIESNELETTGDPFMIFYKLPENVGPEEIVYDVGYPISEKINGSDSVNTATMVEHTVLSENHNGTRDTIQETYKKIAQYSMDNNYDIIGSPKEIYHKGFLENTDDKIIEVQFPVIKMD